MSNMTGERILPFSPGRLPVTEGSVTDFADDAVSCMRNLWAKHGDVAALQEDTQRLHFIFGPEYNKYVLSDSKRFHSRFFAIRGGKRSAQRRVTGGLLSMNGNEHKQQRRIVKEPFQKKSIEAYHDTVVQHSTDMVSKWKPGQTRDISEDMTHYMLRLTSSILFGLDVEDLALRVGELTENWVSLNHRVGPAAFSSSPEIVALYDELLEAAEELEAAVKEMIALRRSGRLGYDVLSLLIRANDHGMQVSDDQLIGHIVLLFGAAHLTSAHTLTWTLFLLSQHPEVMEKLYSEITETIGDSSPTPENINGMPYLDKVLKESMRVLPASAYSQRVTAEPVELGPFKLNPGSIVIFSQFMTHHLPHLFPQPEQFQPDRWDTINPGPYTYLPFGAGARMCVGAALGSMQLKIALPSILKQFKLTCVANSEMRARVLSTMLFPESSIMMKVDDHDGNFASSPITGNIHSLVDLPYAKQVQTRAA